MTSIDPRWTQLVGLRAQLASSRSRSPSRVTAKTTSTTTAGGLSNVLTQRLRGLDPADPERAGKAVRLFLESELVREFGDPLLNDARFAEMLDAVQSLMREDRDTSAAVDALGKWLVDQHPP